MILNNYDDNTNWKRIAKIWGSDFLTINVCGSQLILFVRYNNAYSISKYGTITLKQNVPGCIKRVVKKMKSLQCFSVTDKGKVHIFINNVYFIFTEEECVKMMDDEERKRETNERMCLLDRYYKESAVEIMDMFPKCLLKAIYSFM
eukprot:92880_1